MKDNIITIPNLITALEGLQKHFPPIFFEVHIPIIYSFTSHTSAK